jgi:hypothetical protein
VTLSFIICLPLGALVLPSPTCFRSWSRPRPTCVEWNGVEWSDGRVETLSIQNTRHPSTDPHTLTPSNRPTPNRLHSPSTHALQYSQRPKNTKVHSSMSHRIGNHVAAICVPYVHTSIQTTTPCSEERPQLRRRPGHRAVLNTSVRPLATPSCMS